MLRQLRNRHTTLTNVISWYEKGKFMNFKFGSDPEFFLSRNDQTKSAIGILPSKKNCWDKNGNKFYFDNVLAEIAIKPGYDLNEVLKNTHEALKELASLVFPAVFEVKSAEYMPEHELKDRLSLTAGCEPEYDVYSLKSISPPEEIISKTSLRTAGGHIHLGLKNRRIYDLFDIVRMMDLFVAVPCLFLDTDSFSKQRKKIYGRSGSHRIPNHGLEYRVLGNFWFSSPSHLSLIYSLTEFTLNFVEQNFHKKFWSTNESLLEQEDPSCAFECFGYDLKLLRDCLDNSDVRLAEKFMTFISNYLPDDLLKEIDELAFKDLPDPYKAWKIS
jgi:hypothetical protein